MSIDSDFEYYETVTFDIAEFLKEYEKHPCLWDKTREDFKDRKVRLTAEESLGEKLGIYDLKTLRKKIRSVRGTYNTEIRKIKLSVDSGTGLYIPKLSWFPLADKFLRITTELPLRIEVPTGGDMVINPKKKLLKKVPIKQNDVSVLMVQDPIKNENEETENQYEEEEVLEQDEHSTKDEAFQNLETYVIEDEYGSSADTDKEDQNHDLTQDHNQTVYKPTVRKRKLIERKNICKCESLVHVVKSLKDICQPSENEFAVFGRSVGVQLQNMPIELAVQLQTDIQAHITRTRLEYLRKRKSRDEE